MNKSIAFYLILMVLYTELSFAQSDSQLSGNWLCQTQYGNVTLNFISEQQLIYDGEKLDYVINGKTLRVNTSYEWVDYPFELDGNQLIVVFPEGYKLLFNRISVNQNKGFVSKDNDAYLLGTLCEYGSSSSYSTNSSYSHTNWVYFDGNGNFKYGSQYYYSGDDALASGDNATETGTYQISSNQVILNFNDGTVVKLQINIKQDDGKITELMYGNKLYASGLCE